MTQFGKMEKKELKENYDLIANEFDKTRYKMWDEVVDFLNDVKINETVLDAGCGNGRHLKLVEGRCKSVGVDFSKKLLKTAKEKISYAKLCCGDVTKLPFKSNVFDRVICIATLHHLPTKQEREECVKELYRVLKTKGKVLISVWSREGKKLKDVPKNIKDVVTVWGNKAKLYYYIFDEDELEYLFKNNGFKVIRLWKSNDNLWLEAVNIR